MSVFRIAVYDKDRQFRCQIGNPKALTATVRHNLVSTASVTLPLSHNRMSELQADGARVKISFRGEHLLSGPIVSEEGESDGLTGSVTFNIEDDFRVLRDITGWPVPTSPVTNQAAAEYRTYTGTAESILKTAVNENGVTRMGIPGLIVAPNLGRGAVVPGGVPFRMHYLSDQLFPAIEQAGIGVTVKQVGANLVLDCYVPRTYTRKLSVKGRTLQSVKWSRSRPNKSRVIIGGQGEGTARNFRSITDSYRESTYGMRAETFRDARDDDSPSVMDARGQETLTAEGPKNGISLSLAGTGIFQYGPGGFRVGDTLPVDIGNDVVISEMLREVALTWVSKDYAKVEPTVGELTNQAAWITAVRIAALLKGQRNQERR
ncbi:virus ReqiPepy6 Gp37-like protein [Arthrobacter sp. yr096]|nr:virus ReqiPepy6 Gp37-like protein [Arthrobacter sp. yr096]